MVREHTTAVAAAQSWLPVTPPEILNYPSSLIGRIVVCRAHAAVDFPAARPAGESTRRVHPRYFIKGLTGNLRKDNFIHQVMETYIGNILM
jgi:hypothetical protein